MTCTLRPALRPIRARLALAAGLHLLLVAAAASADERYRTSARAASACVPSALNRAPQNTAREFIRPSMRLPSMTLGFPRARGVANDGAQGTMGGTGVPRNTLPRES